MLDKGKGDRHHLPERPGGCFPQMVPVPFLPGGFSCQTNLNETPPRT